MLDTAIADERPTAEDPTPLVLRAVANIMLGRVEDAQKDLANPVVGNQNDAPLWRALALARQGKWARGARRLPQRRGRARRAAARIAAHRAEGRAARLDRGRRFRQRRQPAQRLQDHRRVARGRARGVGARPGAWPKRVGRTAGRARGLSVCRRAPNDRPAAAQGRLREIALRYSLGETKKADFIAELESLTTAWRGDETEVEALQTAGAALHRGETATATRSTSCAWR